MTVKFRFEELRVYNDSVLFAEKIFILTGNWPSYYRFSLANQLERAAISIPLNIAEGSSRTEKDFKHFITIARGSCYECIPILAIAHSLKLLSDSDYESYLESLDHIAKMLTKLKNNISPKTN